MLDSVLAYINNHLEETISLEALAKVTGYSPYYLHRKLKTELQEPVGNFIIKQRVQAATYLLALTELPVTEVKVLVGYEDDSAFSRVFKKFTGVSPRAFRQQQQPREKLPLSTNSYLSLKCEVVRLPDQNALEFPVLGNYFDPALYQVWEKAEAFIARNNFAVTDFSYFGVLHDCQQINYQSVCRYGAALVPANTGKLPASKNFITTLPGGKFARYKFCCPIADYPKVANQINEHLSGEMKLKHRDGISYFQFQALPSFSATNSHFITWYLPIY